MFYSTPVFVLGILLKDFFAVKVNNAVGHTVLYTDRREHAGHHGHVERRSLDDIEHAVLPVITLVLVTYAALEPLPARRMLDVLNSRLRAARPGQGAVAAPRAHTCTRSATRSSRSRRSSRSTSRRLSAAQSSPRSSFGWEGMGQFLLHGLTGPVSPDVNSGAGVARGHRGHRHSLQHPRRHALRHARPDGSAMPDDRARAGARRRRDLRGRGDRQRGRPRRRRDARTGAGDRVPAASSGWHSADSSTTGWRSSGSRSSSF